MKGIFKKEGLNLAILTLITILTWAGFDIYFALTKSRMKPEVQKLMTPLDPQIEKSVLEGLNRKREISLEEIGRLPIALPSPKIETEEENVSPTPSVQATPTSSPIATGSANENENI